MQDEEDNEHALLMACATVFPKLPPPSRVGDFKISPERRPLCIIEERIFVQLDGEAERDDSLWYLDSRAMNHMSSCCGA
jgi:hypothetical protein